MAPIRVDEIADGIIRISSYYPDAVLARGVTVNQFLVLAEEPLLFHTGLRASFADTLAAVARILPPERLRWLSFGHVEADECGALDAFLVACPRAEVAFGALGCALSLDDLLRGRPPRALGPRRGARPRGTPRGGDPDPARAPQPGGAGPVRADHGDAAVRRPVHADWGRRRP